MDARTGYWTLALLNMAVMAGLLLRGVRHARRGDIARHRRNMLGAGVLVLAFLGSYVLKVVFLGHEDVGTWSPFARHTLHLHELCVFTMIVAGGFTLQRAWLMRQSRQVTRDPAAPVASPALVRSHRMAGRIAVGGAVLGFLTACAVLAGMFARAGG